MTKFHWNLMYMFLFQEQRYPEGREDRLVPTAHSVNMGEPSSTFSMCYKSVTEADIARRMEVCPQLPDIIPTLTVVDMSPDT